MTTDGTATTLTAQEKERPMIAIGGELSETTARNPLLRILRNAYGEETIFQWAVAVLDALQQAEVLQQGMYESSVKGETQDGDKLDDHTLPRPEFVAKWMLRDMREHQKRGCTSQGWKPAEQYDGQSSKTLPELPLESTQTPQDLFDMWRSGEGLGLLQQALYQVQKIWKSAMEERERGGDAMNSVVRRLTPLE